jgi:TonB family protein
MMNQPNNQKVASWKLLLTLPVLAILFMSFSLKIENLQIKNELTEMVPTFFEHIPGEIQSLEKIASIESEPKIERAMIQSEDGKHALKAAQADTLSDKVFLIVEEQPQPSTGDMSSYFNKINQNLRYPEEARNKGISGRVFVQFVVRKDGSLADFKVAKGIGAGCDEEAVRAIKEGPTWVPGKENGQAVNVRMILPINFPGENVISGTVRSDTDEPIAGANVIIKGTTTGTVTDPRGVFMLQVKPEYEQIVVSSIGYLNETIDVVVGKNYEITLQLDPESPLPSHKSAGQDQGISLRANGKSIFDSDKGPLFILDGKEIDNFDESIIKPDNIESISVLKDSSAAKIYGEKARHGVVLINSKSGVMVQNRTDNDPLSTAKQKFELKGVSQENPPLVFVDGEQVPYSELENIDHTSIASIEVLKEPISTREHGDKAKYGVIKITMKKTSEIVESGSDEDLILPKYQGGMEAFYKAIQKSIKYPKEARDENVQGEVKVSFTVTKDGKITDIGADGTEYILMQEIVVVGYASNQSDVALEQGDRSILEEEVARVLKEVAEFIPAEKDGEPVDVRMTLPVTFKIR